MLTKKESHGIISPALMSAPLARVVELVDSLASGASARKGVRVRLPPRAPKRKTSAKQMFFFLLLCPDIMGNLDPGWLSLYNSTIIFRSRLVIARRAKPDAAIRSPRPAASLVKGRWHGRSP